MQYYLKTGGRVSRPFSYDELQNLVRRRRLVRHHLLSEDGLTFVAASKLLPELFGLRPSVEPTDPGGVIFPPPSPWGVEDESPPSKAERGGLRGVILVAGGGIAVLAVMAAVFFVVVLGSSGSDAKGIASQLQPSVVRVQGIHPREGAVKCFGVVVSRNHVIAPLCAATLDGIKVEGMVSKDACEWLSAQLVTADIITGLCVLRADLAKAAHAAELSKTETDEIGDEAKWCVFVEGNGDPPIVSRCRYRDRIGEGEPEEKLVFRDDEDQSYDRFQGAVVTSGRGEVVAMVLDQLPNGDFACVSAEELERKRKEAGKIPADKFLARIDLPTRMKHEPLAASNTAAEQVSLPPADNNPNNQELPGAAQSPNAPEQPADPGTPPPSPSPAPMANPGSAETGGSLEPSVMQENEEEASNPRPNASKTDASNSENKNNGPALGSMNDLLRAPVRAGRDTIESALPLPELTEKQKRDFGDAHLTSLKEGGHISSDRQTLQRLRRSVSEILAASDYPDIDIAVTLLEDSENNAYAFVGGNIVVNTGFVSFADGDQEMELFVLAHEIGHICLGHTDIPFRREVAADQLVPGASSLVGEVNEVLANSYYSQTEEQDADCFAVTVMRRLGKSTQGGIRFFERLALDEPPADAEPGPSLFSSHPDHSERIERIQSGCD